MSELSNISCLPPSARDRDRGRHVHSPQNDVVEVDAPIVAQAVAIVPEPAELVVEAVPVERPLGRRSEPQVVVDARRRIVLSGGLPAPSGGVWLVIQVRHSEDVAQLARLDEVDGILEMLAAALLGADLHYAFVAGGRP